MHTKGSDPIVWGQSLLCLKQNPQNVFCRFIQKSQNVETGQERIPVYLLFREQMHWGVRILSVWSAMAILRWSSRDGIYRHLREVREIPCPRKEPSLMRH